MFDTLVLATPADKVSINFRLGVWGTQGDDESDPGVRVGLEISSVG